MIRSVALLLIAAPWPMSWAHAQHLPAEVVHEPISTGTFTLEPVGPTERNFAAHQVESFNRTAAARALLRQGRLDDAIVRLRNEDGSELEARWLQFCTDARTVNVVNGLCKYADRAYFDAYGLVSQVKPQAAGGPLDEFDAEAALLKSLLLVQAQVYAPALHWARVADGAVPNTPLAKGLIGAIAKTGNYSATPEFTAPPHAVVKDLVMEVWRGDDAAEQPLALVFMEASGRFIGALAVTMETNAADGTRRYLLKFHDLDAPPLVFQDFGSTCPDAAKLLQLAAELHPEVGPRTRSNQDFGAYTSLRAEMEAVYWQARRIAPLAAWWAQRAPHRALVEREIAKPLRDAHALNWKRRGRQDVGPYGSSRFQLVGFSNTDAEAPEQLSELHGPLEHYHFLLTDYGERPYVGSFVLTSEEPEPGLRLFSLVSVLDGEREELKLFPGFVLPDFDQVAEELRQRLTSFGTKMALIPAGEFRMGPSESRPSDKGSHAAGEVRHTVRITKPFYMGVYEVTRGEFAEFVSAENYQTDVEFTGLGSGFNEASTRIENDAKYSWHAPGFAQDDEHPVCNVSWDDAIAFCKWRSRVEGRTYRLPTEAEWEYACRAGSITAYQNGDDPKAITEIGNVADDSLRKLLKPADREWEGAAGDDGHLFTAPVGRLKPNAWGLHDMIGNVTEWCSEYKASPGSDPIGPVDGLQYFPRGGSWASMLDECRSADRSRESFSGVSTGFRVVCEVAWPAPEKASGGAGASVVTSTASVELTKPAVAEAPAALQKPLGPPEPPPTEPTPPKTPPPGPGDVITNSLGMKLAPLPTRTFLMGSRNLNESNGKPQHKVQIAKRLYCGVHEVTYRQFEQFVTADNYRTDAERYGQGGWDYRGGAENATVPVRNPDYNWRSTYPLAHFLADPNDPEYPVTNVSWNDAVAFCEWLSQVEGKTYRLPTEAEWEYACRADSTTRFQCGDDPVDLVLLGNVADTAYAKAAKLPLSSIEGDDGYDFEAPVGKFRPNAFGLYDMHGNVSEWCADRYNGDYYFSSPLRDPQGPKQGPYRVIRGGSWTGGIYQQSSSARSRRAAESCFVDLGFRVVCEQE